MRRQQRIQPQFTEATVPLRREHFVQPAMLDPLYPGKEKRYSLPLITEGGRARVYDADEWQRFNGYEGVVTGYSFFTGLHTVALEGQTRTYEHPFYSREIMKIG